MGCCFSKKSNNYRGVISDIDYIKFLMKKDRKILDLITIVVKAKETGNYETFTNEKFKNVIIDMSEENLQCFKKLAIYFSNKIKLHKNLIERMKFERDVSSIIDTNELIYKLDKLNISLSNKKEDISINQDSLFNIQDDDEEESERKRRRIYKNEDEIPLRNDF